MVLRRLGNKSKIASEIIKHFPPHKIYIELFFGAGGLFFSKPKAQYNIVNDIDGDVFNLFMVLINNKEEFAEQFAAAPYHSDLFNYWRKNKETEPVRKAVRFLYLSNFSFLGTMDCLKFEIGNASKIVKKNIDKTAEFLKEVKFMNCDFREVLNKIAFKSKNNIDSSFVYADPPYLNTSNNYECRFSQNDSVELFEILQNSGMRFAMSEYDQPFILSQAEKRGLNIINIGERQSLKNRRTEILITNYSQNLSLFN